LNGDMQSVEQYLQSQGVPTALVEPGPVAAMIVDGIKRGRFFIRMGRDDDQQFFGGSQPADFFAWNERMIRGRAEAQLTDGAPGAYLW
jgi:hypothetical protein